uniref:NADH:ubiquinone reductase (H(+)-translocating) n=1 Tax=Paurocephala sauteri TaxID=2768670 RepID=A0A7L9R576_9HEMI|nr:NADH dehydrogenase subunit 5 [Paurocephala sauteri]QOL10534.1 NADH dehydrogenase subunit 5 [Paurocephala sauteri]
MKSLSKFYFISFFLIKVSMFLLLLLVMKSCYYSNMLIEFEVYALNSIHFFYIIYIDLYSILFCLLVLIISSMILIYSKNYIMKDCLRFLWLMILFIFFMIIMIFSPSIMGVILGWDGLGMISYSLVIYYQSKDSWNSGFVTAATNRLGDTMLLISIFISLISNSMFLLWEMVNLFSIMFLILACMTKSAQFPFSAWLPAAMAAPTPISSLVHSSTLVTAGVYLLIRFHYILYNSSILIIILLSSLITIIVAGCSALYEMDLKKVVALSTLGQLGFMVMILSMGSILVSFFHLLVHAMFKALLFMCVGCIIHLGINIQDMRKMGDLNISMMIQISMKISSFSLLGIPFSSGFYSKDLLLELILCSNGGLGLGMLVMMSVLLTIMYSMRNFFYLSKTNYWLIWKEPDSKIYIPVFILSILNIYMGSVLNWLIMMDLNFIILTKVMKFMPICLIIMGSILQFFTFNKMKNFLLTSMMFMSSMTKFMSFFLINMLYWTKNVDQGWFEMVMFLNKKVILNNIKWFNFKVFNMKNMFIMVINVSIIYLILF